MWQRSGIQSSLNTPWLVEKKQQLRGVHNHDNLGSGIEPDTVTLLTGDTLEYSPIFITVKDWVQSRTLNEHEQRKVTVWGARVVHLWWACRPPMWPGLKSQHRSHMWVEFVVGSLPCYERFFSGYSGFSLSSKANCFKFQFNLEDMDTFKRVHKNS